MTSASDRGDATTTSREPCAVELRDLSKRFGANSAYIHLTEAELEPGRTTIAATMPPGVGGFVALDWKDDRLVGIEVLDADERLRPDLLEHAEEITND